MRLYHVAGRGWHSGDDLKAWDHLTPEQRGDWKWDAREGWHGHAISFHDSIDAAREFREAFGGSAILSIDAEVGITDGRDGTARIAGEGSTRTAQINEEGYLMIGGLEGSVYRHRIVDWDDADEDAVIPFYLLTVMD